MKLHSIRQYGKFLFSILLMGIIMFALPGASEAAAGDTTRVSVKSDGTQGNGPSDGPSISADGNFVAFRSFASNLVAGDTNANADIFVRDREAGTTTRVSVGPLGAQATGGNSYAPTISADGNFVAFVSFATNLVAGDTNGEQDIFVHNRNTGVTTRVSVATDGTQGTGNDIDGSFGVSISADGTYVAFDSGATNLVAGDTNGDYDVFVRDRANNTTERVSLDSNEAQGDYSSVLPSISADGRYVAFEHWWPDLLPEDTNNKIDILVRDRTAGTTTLVSVATGGAQGNNDSFAPAISADGLFVAFESRASNLVAGDTNNQEDIFVRDWQNGAGAVTERVSVNSSGAQVGLNWAVGASISENGRYVAFFTYADLVAGDTNESPDVYVRDRQTAKTTRVSLASNGREGNDSSEYPSISADGSYVAFYSDANNLVAFDINAVGDVFVHERSNAPAQVFGFVSVPSANAENLIIGPSQLVVNFNKDMVSGGGVHAADSLQNYMLVGPGPNGVFNTTAGSAAICDSNHIPEGDDVKIDIFDIIYSSDEGGFHATLDTGPLADGSYRLYLCGAASIYDLGGNPLNSGVNSAVNFTVGAAAPVVVPAADAVVLPATGFAPHRVTVLPAQPAEKAYTNLSDLWLEVPKLGVKMDIVGVPQSGGKWDVAWLGADAGWLEGSAFPSWEGNSVLTGHVWNADNSAGPFRYINTLWWGDKVIVHAWGAEYVYEVRSVRQVTPGSVSAMMKHEEQPWVTLVTCRGYNPLTDDYKYRVLVRAALVKIK